MRYLNRLLATLLSLLLILASVLLIIEVISDRFRHRPGVVHWHHAYDWAHRTSWSSGSVRTTCIVAIVLGLVLLIAELKPARVSRLPVAADPGPEFDAEFGDDVASGTAAQHAPTDTAYTRSGVAAAIRSAVTGVDGIRSASVKLKRHQVKVSATSAATDRAAADALRAPVTAAIEHRLDDLRLQSRPSLSLSMAPRSR